LTSILALLSGVPALIYQVAWTREIGLLAGDEARRIFRATAEGSDPEGYARMALAVTRGGWRSRSATWKRPRACCVACERPTP